MISEIRGAARALRLREERAAKHHSPPSRSATVLTISPLSVELVGAAVVLNDDDLTLTQWVKKYDDLHGIDVGDTLVLHSVHEGGFLVTDVLGEKETKHGLSTGDEYISLDQYGNPVPVSTTHGTIIKRVPYYDQNGDFLGYVPLYSSIY